MSNIKDFAVSCLLGGGELDWKYLDEICTHVEDEFNLELSEYDIIEAENFHGIMLVLFDTIKEEWEEYISEKEGEDITLDLDYFFNYLDSHIDSGPNGCDLHWSDSKEEAYQKWKDAQNNKE